MESVFGVLVVIIFYLVGMGLFNYYFIPRGVTYHERTHITFLYYAGISVFALMSIGILYLDAVVEAPLLAWISLGILALILVLTPVLVQKFPSYTRLATAYPRAALLSFHYPFVFAKTGEILFQQICVVLLTLFLFGVTGDVLTTQLMYTGIFTVMHLPLFFVLKPSFASAFAGAALVSGFIIPQLVLLVEGGVVYSFIIHWGFYIVLAYFIHGTGGRFFVNKHLE